MKFHHSSMIRFASLSCVIGTCFVFSVSAQPPVVRKATPGEQAAVTAPGLRASVPGEDRALEIDQRTKSYSAKVGETNCRFTYVLKNVSAEDVVITDVKTSCGCTVAKLPSKPWTLPPAQAGELELIIDVTGKSGTLVKTATIETLKGVQVVSMQVTVPAPPMDEATRARNTQLAAANRQMVFQGDCARCHIPPVSIGTEQLYKAACGVCHEAEHRASMVPDLRQLGHETSRDFWRAMIVAGKPGTLMPGFSFDMGGPLNKSQIDSLVDYLIATFPPKSPSNNASDATVRK
jgi:mono/diheme cytochrome c family protein